MENFPDKIIEKAGKAVKNWWLLLISGILVTVASIVVFCYPVESFVALSLLFGIMLLVNGICELVTSVSSHNLFLMRSSSIAGGIMDVFLGIFLVCYPNITIVALPIILGIWMLYSSFQAIGMGNDLKLFNVPGMGWLTAGGVLMLLLSVLVLIMPLTIGRATVVLCTGVALLFRGVLMIAVSLKLRKLHMTVREQYPGPGYGD